MENENSVYIIASARTPLGKFLGGLASFSATQLGGIAIKNAILQSGIESEKIEEVYMGHVLQANCGQAPARQAAINAGIPFYTPCTTVNKVCASGLKSIILGAQSIKCGDTNTVIAGGMESMSNAPHYQYLRAANKFSHSTSFDALIKDGLEDSFQQKKMGELADLCAIEYNITREDQDEFTKNSYQKAKQAWLTGKFNKEVVSISIPTRSGDEVKINQDESLNLFNEEKIANLKPAFTANGTVTAANASSLSDGAAAVVLMSEKEAKLTNCQPIAIIRAYADVAQDPQWFTTAPSVAIEKVLKKASLTANDIGAFEINEAFACVGIVNQKLLHIPKNKINLYGGAVALGHPLGCSGTRIVNTLISILRNENKQYGLAAICNGGGGASAIIIENPNFKG